MKIIYSITFLALLILSSACTTQLVPLLNNIFHNNHSLSLWKIYQNKQNTKIERMKSLDVLDDIMLIKFNELIVAMDKEQDAELHSKLIHLVHEKIIREPMTKDDWQSLKHKVLESLHTSLEPLILVNTLMLSQLLLNPIEMAREINTLLVRMAKHFSEQELIMLNNAINLVLFETMLNSKSYAVQQTIVNIIEKLDRKSVTDSFSVYINDLPEEKLISVKSYLHRYLIKSKSHLYDHNFFKTYSRVQQWSHALLKTKDNDITSSNELYNILMEIRDPVIYSLIVLANKQHLSNKNARLKCLNLLNKNQQLTAKHNNMEEMMLMRAMTFLNGMD